MSGLTIKKEYLILAAIALLFFAIRLPAVHHPYHQDEYKWPIIVNPALTEPGGIPHPPVGEFIYRNLGGAVGYDNFRVIPLVFSSLNLFLIFYLIRFLFDTKTALWAAGLFVVSFYSVLASLMVDTDGAIMPFFALLSFVFYYHLKDSGKKFFLIPLALAVILGFFVKASFIIVIGALVLDFMIERGAFSNRRKVLKYFMFCIGGAAALGLLLFIAKMVFPFFNLESSINYWKGFINFGDRGWLQTFIQFAKSLFYLSPLLVLPLAFVNKEIFTRLRPLFFLIIIGLFFYLVAFDFSTGALDRYFQFLIVPLCVIGAAVLAKRQITSTKSQIISLSIFSLIIFLLQFLSHSTPSLHPKTEWIGRILSFEWNFLFPFTGGSGPLPFYVSVLFAALVWIVSIFLSWRKAVWGILVLGILYNGIFIEEYLFGKINGNSANLVKETTSFIETNSDIKKVVVYNDNGGYEIQKVGKYERRLYAAPQFEETYRKFFSDFSGHVLYIDIPRIGSDNFYSDYLESCENVYEKRDKYITAQILNCRK